MSFLFSGPNPSVRPSITPSAKTPLGASYDQYWLLFWFRSRFRTRLPYTALVAEIFLSLVIGSKLLSKLLDTENQQKCGRPLKLDAEMRSENVKILFG